MTTVWQWTYNAFWGTEDLLASFEDMWSQVPNNKKVGVMLPNDALGIPWLAAFQEALPAAGWDALFSDLYQPGTEDFSTEIGAFKKYGCEIMSQKPTRRISLPFGSSACSRASSPRCRPGGGARIPGGRGRSRRPRQKESGNWAGILSPGSLRRSGETAQQFADKFTEVTGKQWNQSLVHFVVFDWVGDVLKRTKSVDDKSAIMEAVKTTKLDTIGGPIDFTAPIMTEVKPGAGRVTANC